MPLYRPTLDGKPHLVQRQTAGAIVAAVIEKTTVLNFDTVQRDITRALTSAKDDPEARPDHLGHTPGERARLRFLEFFCRQYPQPAHAPSL
jgi:hypothetical protein